MNRSLNRVGLQKPVLQKMALYIDVEVPGASTSAHDADDPFPHDSKGPKRRCETCKESIAGPGAKKRKQNLPHLANQCQRCGKCACRTHTVMVCTQCATDIQFPQAPTAPPSREVS